MKSHKNEYGTICIAHTVLCRKRESVCAVYLISPMQFYANICTSCVNTHKIPLLTTCSEMEYRIKASECTSIYITLYVNAIIAVEKLWGKRGSYFVFAHNSVGMMVTVLQNHIICRIYCASDAGVTREGIQYT